MNDYEECHINLLAKLTREAHAPTTTPKRYIILANAIFAVLNTVVDTRSSRSCTWSAARFLP